MVCHGINWAMVFPGECMSHDVFPTLWIMIRMSHSPHFSYCVLHLPLLFDQFDPIMYQNMKINDHKPYIIKSEDAQTRWKYVFLLTYLYIILLRSCQTADMPVLYFVLHSCSKCCHLLMTGQIKAIFFYRKFFFS